MKVLRLSLESDPTKVVGYYDSHLALEKVLGTEFKCRRTRTGYRITHPIAPDKPMIAEWIELEDK